ncbi:hypothetical protein C8Q76DRAFT_196500 [Earliella scabrosa]|nr:hypothetical protein C8Q76DRAFT_196500 [Earliella scabrosa]
MKFFSVLAPLAALVASASASAHPRPAAPLLPRTPAYNETIGQFLTSSVNAFFPAPGNSGWATAFDTAFSPHVTAHFNDLGPLDFAQFKQYFAAIKANLEAKYVGFEHDFYSVVGVAAADGSTTGGYGIVTGWEGGLVAGKPYYGTDGAFAVVREFEGQLKIVEWHEITNLGSAPL